jgi:carbamoyltransferase
VLLAAAEEDRLSRRERTCGLPRASVQSVFRQTGLRGDGLAAVFVATRDATYAETAGGTVRVPLLWRVSQALPQPPPLGRRLRASFAAARRRRIDESLRSELGVSCPIQFVDHHLAHAAGSAMALGLADSVVVTMDGGADGVWASVTTLARGVPERLAAESAGPSVSAFLDAVADRLGVPPGLDRARRFEELASRGASLHYDALDAAFASDDGALLVDQDALGPGGVVARLSPKARKEDLAASALGVAAHHVRRWATHWYVRCEPRELVLAGDLFEMPAMVRALLDASELAAPRVLATPGDAGLPAGAAFAGCLPGFLPSPLPRPRVAASCPFLGPSYTDEEIADVLAREGATFRHHPRIERDVARVLAEGRTVARFDGRAEIGRRALGNRVLLRHPAHPLRQGRLGFLHGHGAYDAVVREEAFAALFREDRAHASDLRDHPLPVTPREDFAARFPELLGFGRRVRVQTVARESNPALHEILVEFESWTDLPFLAAASFRLPNEPPVSSPLDALRAFRVLGADHAAFGRYFVQGEHGAPPGPDVPEAESRVGGARDAR